MFGNGSIIFYRIFTYKVFCMAHIEGIEEIKNNDGNLTHVVIDVRKHPEAVGKLKEMGLVEKTQFEKDCEDAISVDEAFKPVYDFINSLKWDK